VPVMTGRPMPAGGDSWQQEVPVVSSSFKSTMNIMSGSYSRSFTRGSLPRGSLGPSGLLHPPQPHGTDS
jgi:hypothetical protein